jgi:hypothetical protein
MHRDFSKLSEARKPKIADPAAKLKPPVKSREFFREIGRKGGKLSAAARMAKLSAEQRSMIAKRAVAAREAKRRRQRYALVLPPPDVLRERLKALDAGEAYLIRRVASEGKAHADVAEVWGITEAEVLRRVQDAMTKLGCRRPVESLVS